MRKRDFVDEGSERVLYSRNSSVLKIKASFFLYLRFKGERVDQCTDARVVNLSVPLGIKEVQEESKHETRSVMFSTRSFFSLAVGSFFHLHVTCWWL